MRGSLVQSLPMSWARFLSIIAVSFLDMHKCLDGDVHYDLESLANDWTE